MKTMVFTAQYRSQAGSSKRYYRKRSSGALIDHDAINVGFVAQRAGDLRAPSRLRPRVTRHAERHPPERGRKLPRGGGRVFRRGGTRQDPGTDGWGHYPKSGRAKVYVFPACKDGRIVADVVRLQKGHTEGYEPNITDKIIALAVSAKGGKIAGGVWSPPPPPGPFGRAS